MNENIKRFFKRTKVVSRVLFFVWAGCVLLFFLITLTDAFSLVDFVCTSIAVAAFFLVPAAVIEYKTNPMIAEKNKSKQKTRLIHSIWGVILLEISPFLIASGILGISYSEASEWVPLLPLVLGIGLFLIGVLLISGYITKAKTNKKQRLQQSRESYVSSEQNEKKARTEQIYQIITASFEELQKEPIKPFGDAATLAEFHQIQVAGYFRVIRESLALLNTTTKPSTFFGRYETAIQNVKSVIELMKQYDASDDAEALLDLLLEEKETLIDAFIDRCYEKAILAQVRDEILHYRQYFTKEQLERIEGGVELPVTSNNGPGAESCNHDNLQEHIFSEISVVDGMEGHEFEYFCANLLRKNGFTEVGVTRGSGDQGVDVLATKGGIKYAVQCKNYATPLSNKPVQEVSAGKVFYNCHVGVVLTNSTFTPGAISLANATGVLLWDRSTLIELMKNEQSAVETPIKMPPASQYRETTPADNVKVTPVVAAPQANSRQDVLKSPKQQKSMRIDNIDIDIDAASTDHFGIVLDNFGIEIDEDDDDQIELLFDILSKNGRSIRCDVDIVCNLYAGNRKVTTERETVYKDGFDGRDSVSLYFDKRNISKILTRIELFCQKW